MSLARIELVGFKSFMSPVTIDFREGITAILGPNGCGKTNIVDAVRWVLGEQSAQQLRSAKMENVIFNGTAVHKPMGYALVNMTINNQRGNFPLDYSEITISRKVYRSGISEYFINKTPCRLKDIKELFADTGTGSHSYAVIEQEMIDYVLNDVHGERRLMFEEAAGIVKYRMRREEARRKLKLTEVDLVRLEDILVELGSQVRSLRYQVGKAKRYRKIKERIREWESIRLRQVLSGLNSERRGTESELARIEECSRSEDFSVGSLEKEVEEKKLKLLELERENTELQNRRYEVRRKIQVSEEKVIQFAERRKEGEGRIERARREIEEAEKRLAGTAERSSGVSQEIEELSGRIDKEEEGVREREVEYVNVSRKLDALTSRLMELRQTQLDFLQEEAKFRSSIEHLEGVLSGLDSRIAEARERIVETERELGGLGSDMERNAAEVDGMRQRLLEAERERADAVDSASKAERIFLELQGRLSDERAELARLKSRFELFVRMDEDFEGFPSGARHLLKKRGDRLLRPLAEIVTVEPEFRQALEAVLGGMLDGLVVDGVGDALEMISELSREGLGRVRFFVRETGDVPAEGDTGAITGCLGRMSSLVGVDDRYKDLVENILGEIYVFEETAKALDFLSSGRGRGLSAVTVAGVCFMKGKGIYFFGSQGEDLSLLGRRGEIENLKGKIARLQDEASALERECAASERERSELQRRIRELEEAASKTREDLSGGNEDLKRIEQKHTAGLEKRALLIKSLEEMENSRSDALAKLGEYRLSLQLSQECEGASQAIAAEEELSSLRSARAELESRITEEKVQTALLKGELAKREEELRGITAMEVEFRSIIEDRRSGIEVSTAECSELAGRIDEERTVVQKLLEEESSHQRHLDGLGGALDECRAAIAGLEKELKSRQEERNKILSRENEIRISLTTLETRMTDLIEKGSELYGAELGCYLEGEEIPLTEDEAGVTAEMLEREKGRLEKIGPVNLAAVEEYEEKKTRMEFLLSQKEDLEKAKEELNEAIKKINTRARARFLETIEMVKVYFKETFQVLFEGGEADLTLAPENDPLEADISITARPKGKRAQDISLLSGGERALTALALLFALYKTKPSPFCIFDEVDAPLDDANIRRFVNMLQKFQADTQFIIITHNKRTMEVADSLYGVTMEERGISRVVSVDLLGIEEVMKNGRPADSVVLEPSVSTS